MIRSLSLKFAGATVLLLALLISFVTPVATVQASNSSTVTTSQLSLPFTQFAQPVQPEATTCAVEKIGWIICPIFEGAARAADRAFVFLSEWFLEVPPELFNNESKTKDAWEQARNLANVAFVIAFLILIYSQITGGVMSNYGIKRMLPRLIIAAIAVNVSYYICQAMVDISNLLGFNIKAALDTISKDLPQVFYQDPNQAGSTNTQTSSSGLSAITIGVLGAAGVWALIGLMGGSLGVAIGTIIFILIILMLRKALIILLIVVSPLAFVAYLLPNTENYFKQWLNMFWQLLLVFPIVALLLGGGQLAGGIVLNSGVTAQGQPTTNQNCIDGVDVTNNSFCGSGTFETGAGQAPWGLGLAAAVITVGPLVLVYSVIRAAVAVGGAAFSKMSAQIESASNAGGGGVVALGKGAGKLAGKAAMANGTVAAMKSNWDAREHNKKLEKARKIVGANEDPTALQRTLLSLSSGAIRSDKRAERYRANQANAVKMKKQLTAEEVEAEGMLVEAEALRDVRPGDHEAFYAHGLEEAFEEMNEIAMKAYIDKLVAMGKSGEDQLERVLGNINPGGELAQSSQFRGAMNHVLQNHGAMANTSNGLVTYAYFASSGHTRSLNEINNDHGMWTGMTVAQQANQRAMNMGADGQTPTMAAGLQAELSTRDQFIMDAAGNQTRVTRAEYAAHHNLIGRHDNGVRDLAAAHTAARLGGGTP